MFPHMNYNLENVGLLFRAWFSSTMRPLEDCGHTGDVFICERFQTLYWKCPFSDKTKDRWCVASDDEVILHPCEHNLRLTVMEDENEGLYIAWLPKECGKWWDFKDAFATMKAEILENSQELGTPENPIEIV